jgi:hypothetical protein
LETLREVEPHLAEQLQRVGRKLDSDNFGNCAELFLSIAEGESVRVQQILARKAVVLLLNGRFYWKEFDSSHASNIF